MGLIYKTSFFILLNLLISNISFSQSDFQTWPTIELSGEIVDDLDIKFKYRSKYDHDNGSPESSWFNMGLSYKYEKFSFGLFYKELHRNKSSGNKLEKRPYIDLTYRVNKNMKIRLRNAFRIRENNENIFRNRLRYLYTLRLWKKIRPFAINELFFSERQLKRNRVGIGSEIKLNKKMNLKPSYIFEFFRDKNNNSVSWTNLSALILSLEIDI